MLHPACCHKLRIACSARVGPCWRSRGFAASIQRDGALSASLERWHHGEGLARSKGPILPLLSAAVSHGAAACRRTGSRTTRSSRLPRHPCPASCGRLTSWLAHTRRVSILSGSTPKRGTPGDRRLAEVHRAAPGRDSTSGCPLFRTQSVPRNFLMAK